jgi:hypothetical protein
MSDPHGNTRATTDSIQAGRRERAAGPKPGELWRGIHLLVARNEQVDALAREVPELAKMGVNVIVAEVDYDYAYSSHPELRGSDPITSDHAGALAKVCREHGIRLIPQFQCLGHQSWDRTTHPLLTRYPQFDETPGQFPNNEGIYCRSWCPQHPEVNPIVFELFDELVDAFEADALHVGMDEVFLIASEHCPRCRGHDPAELFAKAVDDYHAHLVGERGVEMLIWGDRLLDSRATGYGEWEAAANGTHPAIDLIPKDIVICDWHYTRRDEYPSIPLFLQKGFRVWPAGWKDVQATEALIDVAQQHRADRMLGHLCTTWGEAEPGELAKFPPLRAATKKLTT